MNSLRYRLIGYLNTQLHLLITITILFLVFTARAQSVADKHLSGSVSALSAFRELKPVEKLYLQTDKPYYAQGDTMRFKAYLLDADYLRPSGRSGLLYVDLDDADGKPAKRIMVPVENGLTWGDIVLDSVETPQGNYILRAYTNWMRNFGDDYIFKKNISISAANNPLLINAAFKQAGDKMEGELMFSNLDGRLQGFKDVQLKVMNGQKNLSKNKLTTGNDGRIQFNFTIPKDVNNPSISLKAQLAGSPELTIPVKVNRPDDTDVQFLPEGGNMVAGIASRIGVKALSADGKGTNITGRLFNNKGEVVSQFNTTHAGMGSFIITPKAGEVYTARINGISKSFPLPPVKLTGTTIAVKSINADSLQITLSADGRTSGTFYLLGQSRGIVCYAQSINFSADVSKVVKTIAKILFPTGVARFSLLNNSYQPLNERIVFVNHHDELRINLATDKPGYTQRDSVALNFSVTDKEGKPVQGNFSVAVTDNSQVKLDSLGNNILNNLLLTSDLKGEIEQPGYYLGENKELELDNLMLTQGWVGYGWNEVFHPQLPFAYKPQPEFTISGKVTNALGKPINRSNIVLLSNNPLIVKDTLSDTDGRFIFKGLLPVDTAIFKLQARNKNGKENNVKIDMDELKLPVFNPSPLTIPWYLNTDSALLTNSKLKTEQAKALSLYKGEGNMLKEVNIISKKVIKGSKNLNGPGEADLIIDEQELAKAKKMTLNDLLHQKIIGITERGRWVPVANGGSIPMTWVLNYKKLHFVFDGMDLEYFYRKQNIEQRYQLIKSYLDYYTAEDITGIELMWSDKYDTRYGMSYLPTPKFGGIPEYHTDAWLEITTRSKHGPFMQVVPGTYLYKTLPFTLARQFYRPRYTANNRHNGIGTDLRTTLHWEPNLITDAAGKATVSFFTADRSADYTIVIEGADMDGQLGYGIDRIKINR